ncbi:MAG TPA: hypothetical protein VJR29_01550 [bacterium]|nr:hypothetical protein [bacterium]
MKGTRHLGFLLLLLVGSAVPATSRALPPFAEYGPACQWVRLIGEIERPHSMDPAETVFLTVTYRLAGQKSSRILMTNQPVSKDRFLFVLSGFDEKIDGVFFVEPGFFFAKKIEFRYYAATADRKWRSRWQKSLYLPELDKQDGNTYCRTGVGLQPLAMEAR